MLWIALYLPQLPLDLAYRRWPKALQADVIASIPLAVTESKRVRWANACAQAAGIVPGMPESSASTHSAQLVVLPRDIPQEEHAVLEAALAALRYTPQVSVMYLGLLMEVSASLKLFGGLPLLIEQLRSNISEMGFTPCVASAPTAKAAWLLASYQDDVHCDAVSLQEVLAGLPIDRLEPANAHWDTLQSIGCKTVGDLLRLPRAGVTRRFGKALLQELDRALGIEPEVYVWYEPPLSFRAHTDLPERIETTEGLLWFANRLLTQMTGWLTARHCAVVQFSVFLHHESRRREKVPPTVVAVRLGQASRDFAHLKLLFQEHLARITLDLSVVELTVKADEVSALAAPNTELFPTVKSQDEALGRLLEHLSSRLGESSVYRVTIACDHRPERSVMQVAVRTATKTVKKRGKDLPVIYPVRPSWILADPLPLLIRHHKPFYQSPLTLLVGPERIEAGWWDEATATRDYFVACNDAYLLLWIFRERQSSQDGEPGWFLHGFFA